MYTLLVNPIAGTGLAEALVSACPRGWQLLMLSQDALRGQLSAALKPGDVLVIAGGDGSVHHTVNALHQLDYTRQVRLAILPFGRHNDLARSFGLTRFHPFELLTIFMNPGNTFNSTLLPYWSIGHHVFTNHILIRQGDEHQLVSNIDSYGGAIVLNQNSSLGQLGVYRANGLFTKLHSLLARAKLSPKRKPKRLTDALELTFSTEFAFQLDGEAYPAYSATETQTTRLAGKLELLLPPML